MNQLATSAARKIIIYTRTVLRPKQSALQTITRQLSIAFDAARSVEPKTNEETWSWICREAITLFDRSTVKAELRIKVNS